MGLPGFWEALLDPQKPAARKKPRGLVRMSLQAKPLGLSPNSVTFSYEVDLKKEVSLGNYYRSHFLSNRDDFFMKGVENVPNDLINFEDMGDNIYIAFRTLDFKKG